MHKTLQHTSVQCVCSVHVCTHCRRCSLQNLCRFDVFTQTQPNKKPHSMQYNTRHSVLEVIGSWPHWVLYSEVSGCHSKGNVSLGSVADAKPTLTNHLSLNYQPPRQTSMVEQRHEHTQGIIEMCGNANCYYTPTKMSPQPTSGQEH